MPFLALWILPKHNGVRQSHAGGFSLEHLNAMALLDRESSLGRVLFIRDDDLLAVASQRQKAGIAFAGIIYAHQLKVTMGQCVSDLELIAGVSEIKEWTSRAEYLPLK